MPAKVGPYPQLPSSFYWSAIFSDRITQHASEKHVETFVGAIAQAYMNVSSPDTVCLRVTAALNGCSQVVWRSATEMVVTLHDDLHFSLRIRANASLGIYAPCVHTAADRHLTSQARLGG